MSRLRRGRNRVVANSVWAPAFVGVTVLKLTEYCGVCAHSFLRNYLKDTHKKSPGNRPGLV
jgi:hypothetical protein